MKAKLYFLSLIVFLTSCVTPQVPQTTAQMDDSIMKLGNFSVSLRVKNIAISRAFYEKLGFVVRGGNQEQNWLVMQNENTIIGLFQGMFEQNILTFNPGWDNDGNNLSDFTDVRDLQNSLKAKGITFLNETDESSSGPAHFIIEDPDGNQIMIDQHVPASD